LFEAKRIIRTIDAEALMNRSLQLRSPRVLSAQSLPLFLVERIDALNSRIDVEWLPMDETIVLESDGELNTDWCECPNDSGPRAVWAC
jgi:hypothetical protein